MKKSVGMSMAVGVMASVVGTEMTNAKQTCAEQAVGGEPSAIAIRNEQGDVVGTGVLRVGDKSIPEVVVFSDGGTSLIYNITPRGCDCSGDGKGVAKPDEKSNDAQYRDAAKISKKGYNPLCKYVKIGNVWYKMCPTGVTC